MKVLAIWRYFFPPSVFRKLWHECLVFFLEIAALFFKKKNTLKRNSSNINVNNILSSRTQIKYQEKKMSLQKLNYQFEKNVHHNITPAIGKGLATGNWNFFHKSHRNR